MTSIADGSVIVQTSSESVPSIPSWFGEVVLIAKHLHKNGVLTKINEEVHFARRRFGHYEVIDFLAVLFGSAMPSAGNAPWKGSTRDFSPLQGLSWPSLSVLSCPPVQRSHAFWQR
ncbi:hypothetical protein [Ktedonobacter robiniae]|uniref:Tn3 transposase DDE domain-containing protein n=1 Tax=Ktedonobacter robiniae TaxID=2778365 RepID=A0ABQ3UZ83_9CHLR|nr:hypothetical protein [Ktedonobacter robiniae]GHO58204.1 hypothetical protein KSB_66790 [Ktedonobacter robiniae]